MRKGDGSILDVVWLIPFFALGAFLYSSVGHGGATIYLAILVLAEYPLDEIRGPVLAINILVAAIAFGFFTSARHFRFPLLWPFLITSVPAAYAGASVDLGGVVETLVLATALTLAAVRLLFLPTPPAARLVLQGLAFNGFALVLGAILGFLAGATGIGGGIFLSPILVFLGWATVKEAGTVASAFIVLNSASGLAARVQVQPLDVPFTATLAAAVFVGGTLGAFFGAYRIPAPGSQRLLGVVLLVAAARAGLGLLLGE